MLNVAPAAGSGATTPISGKGSASITSPPATSSSAWPMRPSGMTIGSPRRRAPSASTYQSSARAASATAMYGTTPAYETDGMSAAAGSSSVAVDIVAPLGRVSARSTRARRPMTNDGSGAIGTSGVRRTSSGSAIAGLLSGVRAPEGCAGTHQQRLGRVQRAVEDARYVDHRKVVDVAEGERDPVVRRQPLEGLAGAKTVERGVPGVVGRGVVVHSAQVALLS